MIHEASLYDYNSFITLTYDEDHLPADRGLKFEDFHVFRKSLQDYVRNNHNARIRYYACGEYGKNSDPTLDTPLGRPHYHAIIFNFQFSDLELVGTNPLGDLRFKSEKLEEMWGKGNTEVGNVTEQSAEYVARYSVKKINGDMAEGHYQILDKLTGEQWPVAPEKSFQSTRPGIGYGWYQKYKKDTRKGYITWKGRKVPTPRYYDKLYQRENDEDFQFLAVKRSQAIDHLDPDKALDRLRVSEEIRKQRVNKLKRN